MFETSYGRLISAAVMRRVCRRLATGDDWQRVGTEELRELIPEHDDDLGELNEILYEAESRLESAYTEA